MVGGLLVSQLLTLYLTPVYYVYIEEVRMWLTHRRGLRPIMASAEHAMASTDHAGAQHGARA